jgi:hypothetical protein
MKATMVGSALLAIAAAMTGCGGSGNKASSTTAATSTAPTSISATKAGSGATAAAPTSAAAATGGGDSGTCPYLSDADGATVLRNAGQPKVSTVDGASVKQTTCSWGTGTPNTLVLIVSEVKVSAAFDAAKQKISNSLKENIDGLGDGGGFQQKNTNDAVIVFFKGKTQVSLLVTTTATTGLNADAMAAIAKKIAAQL